MKEPSITTSTVLRVVCNKGGQGPSYPSCFPCVWSVVSLSSSSFLISLPFLAKTISFARILVPFAHRHERTVGHGLCAWRLGGLRCLPGAGCLCDIVYTVYSDQNNPSSSISCSIWSCCATVSRWSQSFCSCSTWCSRCLGGCVGRDRRVARAARGGKACFSRFSGGRRGAGGSFGRRTGSAKSLGSARYSSAT